MQQTLADPEAKALLISDPTKKRETNS